jgi:hypothetical protein
MRFLSATLLCLGAAALTPCLADPPASTTTASQPATPAANATAPASTSTPAAAPASEPAAAKTASTDSTAAKPTPSDDAEEKELLNAGYTPEMHNGTKLWCKREQEIGSRLGSRQKTCGTAEQLILAQQRAQDQFRQPQAASFQPGAVMPGTPK